MGNIPAKDHLGNEFPSLKAMCNYWGARFSTFWGRLNRGWTVEDSLTANAHPVKKPCADHQGKKFESRRAMCRHWGVDFTVFETRSRSGWTLERALTTPKIPSTDPCRRCKPCVDHLGNEFTSFVDMCRQWHKSAALVRQRLKYGWALKRALTEGKR